MRGKISNWSGQKKTFNAEPVWKKSYFLAAFIFKPHFNGKHLERMKIGSLRDKTRGKSANMCEK